MLTLYDYILHDDCYKIRLLLAMLEVPFQPAKTDVHPGRDNETPAFLALNPLGRIPVLVDEQLVLREPQAILTYIAMKYDPSRTWMPQDPAAASRVAMWLAFAGHDLVPLSWVRSHVLFGWEPELDVAQVRGRARRAMEILEDHFAEGEIVGRRWCAADHPTIADVALFPPLALAAEADMPFEPFPATWRWIDRFKRLPRFTVMPGILPLLPGVAA